MLVNLPAAANGGNGDSRLTAMDAVEGQCEYNFLKRKLATVEHGIPNLLINSHNDGVADAYQGASTAMWKKRHIEPNASGADDANCYDVHAYAASSLHDFNGSTGVVGDHINSSSSGGGCHVPTSASSGSGANSNDLTFNLIGSSSFINDLFAYDANLIVPVSASLISSSGGSASLSLCSPSALPTYTTPTSVCVNAAYDDDAHWQATDLLELDHRYNSGLQTEIAQLQPTVTLKSIGEQLPQHGTQIDQQQQQQQQSTGQTQNYLVPEKQVSRSSTAQHAQPKFRQQQQPQQQQQQRQQQQQQQQQQQHLPQADNPTAAMDTETDFEDKNLSWLLNFKFDELPHLSPDVGANQLNSASAACGGLSHSTSPTYSNKSNNSSPHSTSHASNTPTQMPPTENSRSPKSSTKAGRKFEELVMEVTAELDGSDMIVAENVVIEDTIMKAPKKPPFTYTELIEYALEDKGELTVSGIYQWISDRFPYYKSNDDRWKNSVRHNLSINPHFRKGVKAPQGAGHLWTISSGDSAENVLAWEHKKQRLDLFFKMESMNRERLQQHQQQLQLQHHCTSPHQDCQQQQQQQQQQRQCSYDEADAAAAALISQEMLQHASDSACDAPHCGISNGHRLEPSHAVHELPFNDLMSDEELRKTAGQILNGIHREVEVQSVNSIISTYHDVLLENEDYLNPVHKDVAVNESGLRNTTTTHLSPHAHAAHAQPPSHTSSQYYVTEIDPLELGIQMSHQVEAEEVLFSDEFNLNYFGYNAGTDIVA